MTGSLINSLNLGMSHKNDYKYSNLEERFAAFTMLENFSPRKATEVISLDDPLAVNDYSFEGTDTKEGTLWTATENIKAPKNFKGSLFVLNRSMSDYAYGLHRKFSLTLEENAEVEIVILHDESYLANGIMEFNFNLHKNSRLSQKLIVLGGSFLRTNIKATLIEEGAHFDQETVMLLGSDSFCDINSLISHKSPYTSSNQLVKGIHTDKSHGIFTGKIFIDKNCNGVNGKQLHKTLLLSDRAQVHSEPQLEIFSDDVKCSHGSSTGQIQEDELFYLESRGIDPIKAQALLANGFVFEITNSIQDDSVKKKCQQAIESKLIMLGNG